MAIFFDEHLVQAWLRRELNSVVSEMADHSDGRRSEWDNLFIAAQALGGDAPVRQSLPTSNSRSLHRLSSACQKRFGITAQVCAAQIRLAIGTGLAADGPAGESARCVACGQFTRARPIPTSNEKGPPALPGLTVEPRRIHWYPSLAALREQLGETTVTPLARSWLGSLRQGATHDMRYCVVEEFTDEIVGLTFFAWPTVESGGQLLFDTSVDPATAHVDRQLMQDWVNVGRRAWSSQGLMDEELIDRQIDYGDVFAVRVVDRRLSSGLLVEYEEANGEEREATLAGPRDISEAVAYSSIPVVDVTWDAREQAKLAHFAAAAGRFVEDDETVSEHLRLSDDVHRAALLQGSHPLEGEDDSEDPPRSGLENI